MSNCRKGKRGIFNNKKKNRAFTLIEALLAVSLAGIVLVSVFSSFVLGVKCWQRIQNDTDRQAQELLGWMGRDLRSACVSKNSGFDFKGTINALTFITAAKLETDPEAVLDSEFLSVKYYLEWDGDGQSRSLFCERKENPGTDDKDKGKKILVCRNLENLSFLYFDGKNWERAWNSNEELPRAIKIDASFKDRSYRSKTESFSTIVGLLSRQGLK